MRNSYRYLVDPDDAREALSAFAKHEVIGLDTETFWDSAKRQNHLSLLQLAAPDGEVLVIDALAAGIEEARALLENPAVIMAAHNARFDEGSLKSAGFKPAGLLDTLRLARRALSLKSLSLASVTTHLLGIELDKTYQRSNWRDRPLSRKQLDYAALDARIVLDVYRALADLLKAEGCWEKERDRARLDRRSEREPRPPREQRRLLDRPWTADERGILSHLHTWRSMKAKETRMPDYFICSERTLEHLVVVRPQTLEQLSDIFGLGPVRIARFGLALLEQLAALQ